jgi:hypothetical protein
MASNSLIGTVAARAREVPIKTKEPHSLPLRWLKITARLALLLICILTFSGCASWCSQRQKPFDFALIGDIPYDKDQAERLYPNMIRELNSEKLEFVVHDGDIKSGSTPCTDEAFTNCLRQFETFRHPLVLIFGDNEWTDCGRTTNRFDPLERLDKLRAMFASGNHSLGQHKMSLARQSNDPKYSKFRENVRWEMGNVMFVGLNVPGAINNFGQPEFAERNAANIAWLRESFAFGKIEDRRAIMIIIQANPWPERGSTNRVHAGFREFLSALEQETLAFEKPVVLVHGDSHYFRIDKPLYGRTQRRIENFTRVETFGHPDAHWLRVTVDPTDPQVFTFRQRIVKANLVQHRKPDAAGK